MGPRGHALSLAQLLLIVAPSFILFGYNQAGVGGLLTVCLWLLKEIRLLCIDMFAA
jgi:hypothetical protein